MSKVCVVTPLKDEIENIESLFASIGRQSHRVFLWVIAENGSTDGSKELLAEKAGSDVAENVVVLNLEDDTPYAIGAKYAQIVSSGFEHIVANYALEDDDLIGILDADNFPEESYYQDLVAAFGRDEGLGLASGLDLDERGQVGRERKGWVRGCCRLWRYACFKDAGYIVGPSADTLSLAKAEIRGWRTATVDSAIFHSARDAGVRGNFEYYGSSAHFRGCTPLYGITKGLRYWIGNGPKAGSEYIRGYFKAYRAGAPRVEDPEILEYFRSYNWRLLKLLFSRGSA